MKVKHITTFLGIILGGIIFTHGANAVVTFEGHSDVQFTFKPTMRLTLSDTSSDCPSPYEPNSTFCIENLAPGNQAISNTITVNVSTNSSVGYTLSATAGGPSVDTLTNFTSNNLELPGSTPGTLADTFDMITAGATALSAGKWGYTLDGGTTYGYLPYVNDATATPTILNKTIDAANTGDTGYTGTPNTDIQIGAYADATQLSGAYKNVVNFTAVVNIGMRTVTLAKNSSDVATVEINSVDGTAITPVTSGSWAEGQVLGITATCASGKNFLGWAKSYDFGQLADMDSAATTYAIAGGDITLTAYCGMHRFSTTMQDFNSADASAMSTGDTLTLEDTRDTQNYTVAKLSDGKVWMMTNLNLGDIDNYPLQVANLDSSNTNIVTPVAAATFNSWKKSSGTGTYTAAELIPVSGTDPTSQTPYGTLYNYCAASGGDSRACVSDMSSQLSPSYDICPKGWRLPTGGSSGEFQTLYSNSAYNTNAKMRAPYTSGGAAFALAGYFSNSTPTYQGSYGFYWSSTRSNSTNMYDLYLNTSNVNPANDSSRRNGVSIRCVLK